jgi:hypothetical protein
MAPEAIIIEETDNSYTRNGDNGILEEQRMPYPEQERLYTIESFHIFVICLQRYKILLILNS